MLIRWPKRCSLTASSLAIIMTKSRKPTASAEEDRRKQRPPTTRSEAAQAKLAQRYPRRSTANGLIGLQLQALGAAGFSVNEMVLEQRRLLFGNPVAIQGKRLVVAKTANKRPQPPRPKRVAPTFQAKAKRRASDFRSKCGERRKPAIDPAIDKELSFLAELVSLPEGARFAPFFELYREDVQKAKELALVRKQAQMRVQKAVS